MQFSLSAPKLDHIPAEQSESTTGASSSVAGLALELEDTKDRSCEEITQMDDDAWIIL